MEKFPLSQLQPQVAIISGKPEDSAIEIFLKPFNLDGSLIDTQIMLSGINIPSLMLSELIGKTFYFPINPENGYIDGSIYIDSAHHPVDVTNLAFHLGRDDKVTMVIKGILDFEFEGLKDYEKTPFSFGVKVASCAV